MNAERRAQNGLWKRIEQDYLRDGWRGVDHVSLSHSMSSSLLNEAYTIDKLPDIPLDRPSFSVRIDPAVPADSIWLMGRDGGIIRIVNIGEDADATHP